MAINFTINGKPVSVEAPPETPLLWVVREGTHDALISAAAA